MCPTTIYDLNFNFFFSFFFELFDGNVNVIVFLVFFLWLLIFLKEGETAKGTLAFC